MLAAFHAYQDHTTRTVRVVLTEHQCFAHYTVQADGTPTTQVAMRFEVYDLTNRPIWLTEARLDRPRPRRYLNRMVTAQHQESIYRGHYELPPRGRTSGSAHFIVEGNFEEAIKRRGVRVRIADQDGHWHPITLSPITILPAVTVVSASVVTAAKVGA